MSILRSTSVIAALLFAAPALAQGGYYSGDPRIDRWSEYGRQGVGRAYYYSGARVCGRTCGSAAQRGGYYIYDRSREWATTNGERLQHFGRSGRERYERRRRR